MCAWARSRSGPAFLTRTVGMGLRLLSGQPSRGVHERSGRHIRSGPRRLRSGVASVSVKPDGSGFSGLARGAGLDHTQICNVGTRRADVITETKLFDDVPLRPSL